MFFTGNRREVKCDGQREKSDTEFTVATRKRDAKGLDSHEVLLCQLDLNGDVDKKGNTKLKLFRSVAPENLDKVATMCLGEIEEATLHNGPRMHGG